MPLCILAQHPVTFFTKAEAAFVKSSLDKYPVLRQSYKEIKSDVDVFVGKDVDVPFPKDQAGGYTHDKHKANYTLMFNSGLLYNLTGDAKYSALVKNMLLKYAALNPTLKNHPEATSSSPGRIFWQALNDANWLVYTGMAYDLVYNSLSAVDKKTIETGAFKPEVDFFTKEMPQWFNLIHNHAVWATAGVGMVGIASGNKDWIDMALYGTNKDGKSGFLALMDGLFSPDGYYTEGPYYVRYAILPYYVFATALDHAKPELNIFKYRDNILQKALQAGLQQTNIDGRFFSFNDALKEKDFTSNELVTAIDVAWDKYGKDAGLLMIAKKQARVLLNKGGVSIAQYLTDDKNVPEFFPYRSVENNDGAKGDEGGVSILRNGKGKSLSSLIFKYSSHGLSHGHYDKLNINFYDKGNEVLTDYGAVRFIGVEQKYGGRYLPVTKSYAAQTIAHNTIVVDEKSDFDGKESASEKYHPEKLFSSTINKNVQVVAARDINAYKDVQLQRTVYMLDLPGNKKIVVDVFNANSDKEHQYDLPFHYDGQLISTSVAYKPFVNKQETLGNKNGYQFLWKEAEAEAKDTVVQLTILNNRTYYSINTLVQGKADIFFTRSGAGDPNFNLRHEPAMIIRKKEKNVSFLSVIEVHGSFDPISEFSSNAYSAVKNIQLLQQDDAFTVVEIIFNNKKIQVLQCNKDFEKNASHTAMGFTWKGPYAVIYDEKNLSN
ncbi:MAG: alginate lyase family protein [Ferruginibacter sp.]